MKGICLASLALAPLVASLVACGAGDDVVGGARGYCAAGGELTDCPDTAPTAQAACWRLVECGAIPVEHDEDFRLDWGSCVDRIQDQPAEYQRLVINCISASTCDQLRTDGAPDEPDNSENYCLQLGDRP